MHIDRAGAAEQNLLKALALWAQAAEGGQVTQLDGCTLVRCEMEIRAFNQVLVTRQPTDVAALIARTSMFFREVNGRFRLRLRDDIEPISDEPFLALGLTRQGGIPCLTIAASRAQVQQPHIDIRSVSDEETLTDHVGVVAAAFDWRPEDLARVLRPSLLNAPAWRAFVGYLDDEPVTTTQLVVDGDVGGLYYVGTVEAARGGGMGEAITRHAISQAAAAGCSLVTLQASPMGLPIYERIGFERASYYRTFVPAAT